MDRIENYRNWIQQKIREHASYSKPEEGIEEQAVFDTTNDHYHFLQIGWKGEHRVRHLFLQVDIKDGKIWIQYDTTERGLAIELLELGVPKEDIVLGFKSPYMRKYSDFANPE